MTPPQPELVSQLPSSRNMVVPKKPPPKLKNETSWSAVPCSPPALRVCPCERLLTEEFNSTKLNTLRRFSGNSVTCWEEISSPTLALSVCSKTTVAVTSTCSDVPTFKLTFWLADWPTS